MTPIAAETDEAYRILPGRADAGLVLLCDHAENTLPAEYGTLGLAPAQLRRHIAYDPGTREITEQLSASLGVPAVLSRFSRLLIDPNRGTDDPTLIMQISDGAVVPGNRHVDADERQRRIRRFHAAYHHAVERVIEVCLASGRVPAVLSLHSFTDRWKGAPRPWHVGILWDKDLRLARPLISAFAADRALVVGDNQPYLGTLKGDTIWTHATTRGLPAAIIEYRQDLVGDAAGQARWSERTEAIVRSIMSCSSVGPPLTKIEAHGSLSDRSRRATSPSRSVADVGPQQEVSP